MKKQSPRRNPLLALLLCVGLPAALAAAPLLLPPTAARAQDGAKPAAAPDTRKRVALVIGNTNYGGGLQLTNPVNDAKAMAKTLRTLGFTVLDYYDLDARQMVDAVDAFQKQLDPSTVALFYFSGHGAQVGGENYLIPVGFKSTTQSAMQFDALPAARVTAMLSDAGTPVNIVIMDACRNNPFEGKRVGGRGLSFLRAGSGTLIAYATAPGSTADDNAEGGNGLYTSALLSEMVKPGVSLATVFMRVRARVKAGSHGAQTPWESSSLSDDFYFAEPAGGVVAAEPDVAAAKPAMTTEKTGGSAAEVNTRARLRVTCNAPGAVVSIAGKTVAGGVYSVNLLDEASTTVDVRVSAPGYEGKIVSATLARGTVLPLSVTLEAVAAPEPKPKTVAVPPPTPKSVVNPTPGPAPVPPSSKPISGRELLTLTGHCGGVWCASFSPNSRRIVTASGDSAADVWDAATGTITSTLVGHRGGVWCASFSPDGRRIVTAGGDNTAKVWDAATGKELLTFTGHRGSVLSATFSPDGHGVVTASGDNKAKLWDAATGKVSMTFTGHRDIILFACFSPDGRHIVTTSWDKTAKIWDVATGKVLATLVADDAIFRSASFSPDGRYVATASRDKTAKLWDAATGRALLTFAGHSEGVNAVSFSPNGGRLITASSDKTAKVWDVATGKVITTLRGHTGGVNSASFSRDGRLIVTASDDKTAKVWILDP